MTGVPALPPQAAEVHLFFDLGFSRLEIGTLLKGDDQSIADISKTVKYAHKVVSAPKKINFEVQQFE